VLDITNVNWLRTSQSDWASDFVAWMYYRQSEWQFPIGVFQGYSYPETVSIGLTGAIPLFAIPFKLLDPILPEVMQYYGIWLLICFILQAYFSYKILEAIKIEDPIIRFIGACIMVINFTFLDRIGHLNLCGHWLILAGILWYFKSKNIKQGLIAHAILVALAVCVHPYLIVFNVLIGISHVLKEILEKKIKWYNLFILPWIFVGSALLLWFLLGNHLLDAGQGKAVGFGLFSANLNTFFTPNQNTLLSSAIDRIYPEQFEGAAYLGIGFILSLFFIPYLIVSKKLSWKWNSRNNAILLVACGLFAFAVSHRITINQKLLFEIPMPNKLLEYSSIFRASGRFVWLLYYLVLIGLIYLVNSSRLRKRILYIILSLILIINGIDFYDLIKRNKYVKNFYPAIKNMHESEWASLICGSDKLRMYPPYETGYLKNQDHIAFAYVAAPCNKEINAGHLARYNDKLRSEQRLAWRDSLLNVQEVGQNQLGEYTFITTKDHLSAFELVFRNGLHQIYEIDNYYALIPKSNQSVIQKLSDNISRKEVQITKESIDAFFERNRHNYIFMVVRDEASQNLSACETFIELMNNRGSKIKQLKFRESYASILSPEGTIHELFGIEEDGKDQTVKLNQNIELSGLNKKDTIEVELLSSGKNNENMARIFVNNKSYSAENRGLNILVLDPSGQVIETTSFDTYESCHHFTDKSKKTYNVWKIN